MISTKHRLDKEIQHIEKLVLKNGYFENVGALRLPRKSLSLPFFSDLFMKSALRTFHLLLRKALSCMNTSATVVVGT